MFSFMIKLYLEQKRVGLQYKKDNYKKEIPVNSIKENNDVYSLYIPNVKTKTTWCSNFSICFNTSCRVIYNMSSCLPYILCVL